MTKLDGNERWQQKMLLTEHVEQYQDGEQPEKPRNRLNADERTMVRDLILLPYIDTMVGKSILEIERGQNVLQRAYLLAGRAIQKRVMKDIYELRKELKKRNIKVVEAEIEDFLIYHTIFCRGYQERFGITRDELRTQISLRLTRYTSELGDVIGNNFK